MMRWLEGRLLALYAACVFACLSPTGVGCADRGKHLRDQGIQFREHGAAEADEELPDRLEITDAAVGPGDVIEIHVYRHADLDATMTVPRSGRIFLPLAGEIDVREASPEDVRRRITTALDRYIVNPQVRVEVTLRRSQKVMVLGEVKAPGIFVMESPMTVLEAIARAGGFTEEATPRRVVIVRENATDVVGEVVNLERTWKSSQRDRNAELRRGDIVYVPRSTIADIDRWANRIARWLMPIVRAESAVLLGYRLDEEIDRRSEGETDVLIGN
jgi:polysaccharide export outer membrane protein